MLEFNESVRGPICNNVTILNDDIYEADERLALNLSTTDASVILDPAGGVMIIQDEDSGFLVAMWLTIVRFTDFLCCYYNINFLLNI